MGLSLPGLIAINEFEIKATEEGRIQNVCIYEIILSLCIAGSNIFL